MQVDELAGQSLAFRRARAAVGDIERPDCAGGNRVVSDPDRHGGEQVCDVAGAERRVAATASIDAQASMAVGVGPDARAPLTTERFRLLAKAFGEMDGHGVASVLVGESA